MNYQISENMQNVKGSAIREIFKVVARPDIISFAGGMPSPDTFPIAEINQILNDVLKTMPSVCFQYGITEGYLPLVEKIDERLKKQGTFKENNITITTAGGQQAIDLAAKAILNPGDTVIVEQPSFVGALNSFRTYGAKLIGVPVSDDGMDVNKVEEILKTDKTVRILYTIPTFQNPSGITMSLEKRQKLLALCEERNVVIFEDNPYGELRFTGTPVPTIKSLDKNGVVMYFGSFSKILSPGLRVGFCHGMAEIMERIIVAKQVNDVHTAVLNQVIAAEWMIRYDIDEHIKKAAALYGHKREIMLCEMDKKFPKEVKYTRPEGGIFIWGILPEGTDSNEIVKKCIEKKVAFVPGPTFMTDIDKISNCFRLNYSNMPDEKIIEGIGILAEVLKM